MRADAASSGTMAKAPSWSFLASPELGRVSGLLRRAWKWVTRQSAGILSRGAVRRLRVAETVSLGEKRFVSILHVDGEQFLVGGSSANVVLLAKLDPNAQSTEAESFGSVVARTERSAKRPEAVDANGVTL